jgi:large subunit ribosomal protein L5
VIAENPMKVIKLGKVVVNISVGASGQPLNNAMTILQQLTGQHPAQRRAKQTIRQWGIRRNEPMACMVTLRGKNADEFLRKAFQGVRNQINIRSFDKQGNFAFGIPEHIDIPGTRYDPDLGIIGMDVSVSLERPGYRVKWRKRGRSKIGSSHRVTPEDARQFVSNVYGVQVGKFQ